MMINQKLHNLLYSSEMTELPSGREYSLTDDKEALFRVLDSADESKLDEIKSAFAQAHGQDALDIYLIEWAEQAKDQISLPQPAGVSQLNSTNLFLFCYAPLPPRVRSVSASTTSSLSSIRSVNHEVTTGCRCVIV